MLLLCVKLPLSRAKEIVNPSPDVSDLRPMLQEPAVRCLVLPARIARVFPQQFDLVCGVSGVPERIAEILTWACFRFHCLTQRRDWWNVWIKDWLTIAASPTVCVQAAQVRKRQKCTTAFFLNGFFTLSWIPGSATARKGFACQYVCSICFHMTT